MINLLLYYITIFIIFLIIINIDLLLYYKIIFIIFLIIITITYLYTIKQENPLNFLKQINFGNITYYELIIQVFEYMKIIKVYTGTLETFYVDFKIKEMIELKDDESNDKSTIIIKCFLMFCTIQKSDYMMNFVYEFIDYIKVNFSYEEMIKYQDNSKYILEKYQRMTTEFLEDD